MRHELLHILDQALIFQQAGIQTVLATVVALDGSSYRRPGVRMLLAENGQMVGAVSGGCVEKEVLRQSGSVFRSGKPAMMTYDGRYRLGCEGVLYILLEPVKLSDAFVEAYQQHRSGRGNWQVRSWYGQQEGAECAMGSVIGWGNGEQMPLRVGFDPSSAEGCEEFSQILRPRFQLTIIGAEHDAVSVCSMAAQLGWEVEIVSSLNNPARAEDFPGAERVLAETPETLSFAHLDSESAVVLMTHNYALDLRYLTRLTDRPFAYLGVLGSVKRSHRIQNELMDALPDIPMEFWERFHSPAGLHLGAETPEEIAMSILSEILAVRRSVSVMPLRDWKGEIHRA